MNQIYELTWLTGGPQGSGVDTSANIFAKTCALAGLYIYGKREYHSNIKGEHSYFTIRVSNNIVRSHKDSIDILVAYDAETIFRHGNNVINNGYLIYDQALNEKRIDEIDTLDKHAKARIEKQYKSINDIINFLRERGVNIYPIEFNILLNQLAEKHNLPLSKLLRVINVMTVSASLALLNIDKIYINKAIESFFKGKRDILMLNIDAINISYNYCKNNFNSNLILLTNNRADSDIILLQGVHASALGKISAGCRFQTYYPITPATDESEYLEANQILDHGSIVVIQTEDEISAITMATGAALAGARASTSTSGPGFSLMSEGLGWAGMNEVPVVITLYQRAGPSTGLPTRHEQGDLLFAIHAGHGEFPRAVIASGDIEEIYYDTILAFNYAERYQIPVIHLLDKALANSLMTCKRFNSKIIKIDRGRLLDNVNESYKRFEFNINPISARVRLGTKNAVFWNTGDEHDEYGHITEDPEERTRMMSKRMSKLDLLLSEVSDNEKAILYNNNSQISIISWGSTKGAILDALDMLKRDNININFIQLKLLHPFPYDYIKRLLNNTNILIDVEMNYSAQLSKMIRECYREPDYKIVKFNGRPISCEELYHALKNIIYNKSDKRVVLNNGI